MHIWRFRSKKTSTVNCDKSSLWVTLINRKRTPAEQNKMAVQLRFGVKLFTDVKTKLVSQKHKISDKMTPWLCHVDFFCLFVVQGNINLTVNISSWKQHSVSNSESAAPSKVKAMERLHHRIRLCRRRLTSVQVLDEGSFPQRRQTCNLKVPLFHKLEHQHTSSHTF